MNVSLIQTWPSSLTISTEAAQQQHNETNINSRDITVRSGKLSILRAQNQLCSTLYRQRYSDSRTFRCRKLANCKETEIDQLGFKLPCSACQKITTIKTERHPISVRSSSYNTVTRNTAALIATHGPSQRNTYQSMNHEQLLSLSPTCQPRPVGQSRPYPRSVGLDV
jgi:hypothetical protein